MTYLIQVRVTGILIEDGEILLVKQKVSDSRAWSLPGGRLEQGETLESAVERELKEETGLVTKVKKLLYVCDVPEANPSLIHITFLMKRYGGDIVLPTNEFDKNPITEVKMVPVNELVDYGFKDEFIKRVQNNFPESGNYMGRKISIGL
jgi:ADP-ribose pyrophosphatase YjhB (NUDIX family)